MTLTFPAYSGVRCLMMPYIQGDPSSVPVAYRGYSAIIQKLALQRGKVGWLTIDESPVTAGQPHRGARARYGRAVHTEAGRLPGGGYKWGTVLHGEQPNVLLERDTQIAVASSLGGSCAVWDAEHWDMSEDGDLGHVADRYPYENARVLAAGKVATFGIATPHESLPIRESGVRQFIRLVGQGVHGREPYFTINPLM